MTTNLAEAARYALAHPSPWPLDLRAVIEGQTFDPPPWNVVKGRVRARGGPAGMIAIDGDVKAHWGDRERADMVFSVTKSYVAFLAGVALDKRFIPSLTTPVAETIEHPAFTSPRNRQVTWLQLLQQTSEWQGTLWGIPDTVDRDRQLSPTDDPARFSRATALKPPGTYWDYNDTRVNALCLALTLAFRRLLPDVLATTVPAFADRGIWDWTGYGAESTIGLGEVVVGGGHWGGGLAASVAQDLAFGELMRKGSDGAISGNSIAQLLTPCPLQPVYGALWWLNTGRRLYAAAPETSTFALGVGMNAIWVDRSLGLTAAIHWIDERAFPGFVERVMAAAVR